VPSARNRRSTRAVFSRQRLTRARRPRPAIYAELARGTAKTAYNWALSDWFNPPVIGRIERRKGRIRVQASDNVLVTKVRVKIMDEEGKVLEQGEAVQANAEWWEYPSSNTEGTVEATAWDLAGNRTVAAL